MILPRARCYDRYYNRYYTCNSAWSNWARWLVLALILIGFFVLFFLCSCLSARRRRKQGLAPFRGTGWAVPGHGPVQYNPNATTQSTQPYYQTQPNSGWSQPVPAYSPPPNNTHYGNGENAGYYGQQSGIEMQNQPSQPQTAYQPPRGGDNVYQPPSGPPPGKADGAGFNRI